MLHSLLAALCMYLEMIGDLLEALLRGLLSPDIDPEDVLEPFTQVRNQSVSEQPIVEKR